MRRQAQSLDITRSEVALRVIGVLAGVGLLAASARLAVPFYPVPLTMQTLAVLLLGGVLGPTLGAATVASYLAVGAMGAPVFAKGLGGVAVLAGPTGGYLVGFLAAAWLMGWAAREAGRMTDRRVAGRKVEGTGRSEYASPQPATGGTALKSVAMLTAGAVAAEIVIYAAGVPWLALSTGMGLRAAVGAGLVPFLLGDLLKMAVAVAALRAGARIRSRRASLPL